MKVFWMDGRPMEEVIAEWEAEDEVKNFRNWLNNKFPNSYAGGYNFHYAITHPWIFLNHWSHEIKWAWQRVFRGWDDRAAWGIDYYLSDILPGILRQIKENSVGIPVTMFDCEPYPVEGECLGYNDDDMAIATEKWNKILDKIADGFEAYKELDTLPYEEYKKSYDDFMDGAFETFKKNYRNLGD